MGGMAGGRLRMWPTWQKASVVAGFNRNGPLLARAICLPLSGPVLSPTRSETVAQQGFHANSGTTKNPQPVVHDFRLQRDGRNQQGMASAIPIGANLDECDDRSPPW